MNKTWIENLWYWRLAVVRVLIYAAIVAWPVFKSGTNGFESLGEMKPLARGQMFGDMGVAAFGVILAFLDSTMAALRSTNGNGKTPEPPKTP